MVVSETSLRVGDVLGARFRVDTLVRGRRASARFLGIDLKSGDPVAIEVVTAAVDAAAVGVRFLASARRAKTLASPHVVRVLDAGVTQAGDPFVVTELLHDKTLTAALATRGSFSVPEAIDVAIDVCEALAHAHASGLLHGDLSTDCVHVGTQVKVGGIGTARALLALRDSGEMRLRAPEQLDPAQAIDARTDVWAAGVVLYTMLAGASPFAADSPSDFNVALAFDEPAQLAGVPDGLADLVDSCLAKNPALRPWSIIRLAEELVAFASDPDAAATRVATWEEHAPDSMPTTIAGRYDALEAELEAIINDADSTAPRNALAAAQIRSEGGVDVSDPRLEVLVDVEPSVRDVAPSHSDIPPPVSRTLPPPKDWDLPTRITPKPARRGMHPMLVAGISACAVVATLIAVSIIKRSDDPAPPVAAAAAPAPPPPAPKEIVPAATAAPAFAPKPMGIAASALPDSRPAAPAPVARPHVVKKSVAASPAAAAEDEKPAPPKPPPPQPEPKAEGDDLRKFLDDRH